MDNSYLKDVIHAITANYTDDCNELLAFFKSDQTYIEDEYKDEFQFFRLGARLIDPVHVEHNGRHYWKSLDNLYAWDEHNEVFLKWISITPAEAEDMEGTEFGLSEIGS